MYLHKLTVHNFKNYPEASFTFSDKINCLIGNNGVGKTNLLDAIHYLSFCKSYFTSSDSLNIRHDQDFFAIHGTYFRQKEVAELLQCIQKRNQKKRFLFNKKEYERLADHIGLFPLVMISPYDRDLINDGSDARRKYMDSVISQFDRAYLDDLIQYNKALTQRNALLRSFAEKRTFSRDALEIWDAQMIQPGNRIFDRRRNFLADFIPLFRSYFSLISDSRESVDMIYQSQLQQHDMSALLIDSVERDRSAGFSTAGTHKDDLEFLMDGHPVKRFGSQGQQKSFVIAVKLAQFEFTARKNGFKPLLLLDDIFDKLDDYRVRQLIRLVSEQTFGQVFLTDTQEENIRKIFDPLDVEHKIFRIQPTEAPNDEKIESA